MIVGHQFSFYGNKFHFFHVHDFGLFFHIFSFSFYCCVILYSTKEGNSDTKKKNYYWSKNERIEMFFYFIYFIFFPVIQYCFFGRPLIYFSVTGKSICTTPNVSNFVSSKEYLLKRTYIQFQNWDTYYRIINLFLIIFELKLSSNIDIRWFNFIIIWNL